MWTDFQIFLLTDSWENSLMYTHKPPPQLRYVAALPCESWKSKNVIDFDSIPNKLVEMFLRTLWGLDLTFDSSSTDCLKTADIKWLTITFWKFVRRRLESTVERCCIMVIFFTIIIFAPSSFSLCYRPILHVLISQ